MIKKITNIGWYEWRIGAKIRNRSFWKKRNKFAHLLEKNLFTVKEFDNPWRLNAYKENEEFVIDCQQDNIFHTRFTPVKWVYGHTEKPVFLTDIPDSGRHGIWNNDSKYEKDIQDLINTVYS